MERYQLFIDGQFRDARSGKTFESFDPFTGKPWCAIPAAGVEDVNLAVEAAHRAFTGAWGELTASQRGGFLRKLGDLIAANATRLAEFEVRDNGKLMTEMAAQLNYIPNWFYYYGGLADKIQGSVIPLDKKGYFNFTQHVPMGVVAAITPWNSPLLLMSWKVAPALAAGCTVVLKPSEFTSASSLEFAKLTVEAGFPPGVFNVITGLGADTGTPLIKHPLVKKITFTGSDATGRQINQSAAADFKHVSLELGGKSPNVVFEDANLDDAVNGVVSGIFAATGQTCIAGSRLLVQESIHDAFVERLVAMAKTARMGNPADANTQVGPITTQPQYQKVLKYIDIAREEGARLVLGGGPATRPECGNGWFIEPTIYADVKNEMRIAQEEVFGPVLSIIKFRTEEDAVRIANDTLYGLGAGIWTKDTARAFRVSSQIQAGTVWVNTYRAVSYLSPFGGFKHSGIGRENGIDAVKEYLQTKSVWINIGAPTGNPFSIR